MRVRWFLVLSPLLFAVSPSTTAEQAPPSDVTSTLDDQTELAVTVYNSDIALVRDVRNVRLPRGTFDLRYTDIAATVNPATVHFRSTTEPSRVSVLEQNYEYDLLDPDKLLRKYVGRDVTLVRDGASVRARLLSYNTGPIWQIDRQIVTGVAAEQYRFPELPDNLYTHPTLIWTLQNDGQPRHRVEASYLAQKLAWNADYVLTVGRDDKSADVDGWVTVTNGSGTSFRKARLQLVAGDVNRVKQMVAELSAVMTANRAAAAPVMTQESFSDYHLYTVGRKTTINNNETKQISMLTGTAVPVHKRYVVEGQQFYYRNASHPGSPTKDVVQVYYEFKNDARSGLGMPMPAGNVRVYQSDASGGVQFVGEDRIDHTPKDETLRLHIGNAFDVVCERQQTNFEKIAASTYEIEYAVTLRNHKPIPVSIEVNEPVGGTWRVVRSSHEWTKSDASALRFVVPVAADSAASLTYRVRVMY
jgi:hypothetical protein